MSRMRPRLQPILLSYSLLKAGRPLKSRLAQILVTDHSLGYVLCLLYWGRVLLQEIEDNESTVEFAG